MLAPALVCFSRSVWENAAPHYIKQRRVTAANLIDVRNSQGAAVAPKRPPVIILKQDSGFQAAGLAMKGRFP
jgi:hypothetical protein